MAIPLLVARVALTSTVWLALPIYALLQAANSLVIVNGISLRQRVTPDRLQGRVNATAHMIAWGGTPFGATIAGVLAETLSVLGWFSPLWEKEETFMQQEADAVRVAL